MNTRMIISAGRRGSGMLLALLKGVTENDT